MGEKKHKVKVKMSVIIAALLLIVMIAGIYILQLNQTVSDNIIQNITELAEHDQNNIQSNVKAMWGELVYLEGKFDSYHCETIEQMETQMNVECANSVFSHIYLVGEDGKVYTDKFVTYDPESEKQNGRIDLLPFFEDGVERIVRRFDDKVDVAGLTKKSILYGIRLENFTVEEVPMVALVGISDIGTIQNSLAISSFTKDGVSRGYSAVIDTDGNYVVNVGSNVYLNSTDNFLTDIDNGIKSELNRQEIVKKMHNRESFSFSYSNENGIEQIIYCMPFEEEDIGWYFLSSVESSVFMEQNRVFLTMSMFMLVGVVVVIIIVLIFVQVSQNKVITANAEAKASGSFLANMSHEIRTPLNGIIGLLYLLEKDLETGEEKEVIVNRLGKAKGTAEYLLSVINNVLDISKLQAGKISLNRQVISPELITDAVRSMQKSNIEDRGIEFIVETDITVPWIIGDELVIKQVLMNILSNAAKFTPSGGRIVLSVRQEKKDGDDYHVSTIFVCQDNGCGMSEKFLEHIWDSFSQERGNNEESVKGTGLGMAISKLLVDAMGGEIRVESKQGKGSTFYVTIPSQISAAPKEFMKEKEISQQNEECILPSKVLVVEDHELNAEILMEILKGHGFEAVHAENGKIAVDMFRESPIGEFSIILMDMQMPVMDGCTATKEIRSMDREDAKSVTIFACTANNFNEDREKAKESGMNDFLSKPINVNELLRKLGGKV